MRPYVHRFGMRGFLTLLIGAGLASASLMPASANVNVSKSGWAWANPTPQGRTLLEVAFSGGVGYAVGSGGTALSTSDGGQSWSGLTTGTSATLERVQAVGPSTVIVGGGEGCVTRISENGGALFRRIFNVAEAGCPEPVAAFNFVNAHQGFLLLRNGSVELTGDGGETFSRRTGIPGTAASSGGGGMVGTDIHFFSAAAGLAFVSDPNSGATFAYRTPDAGVSWVPIPLPPGSRVTSVHFVDENNGYAIGPGTLIRTTDGGETWKQQPIAAGNSFSSIDCSSAKACLLTVTAANELIETEDGGATDIVKTTSSSPIYSAAYASPSRIVAVGEGGATVLSSDGGATFTSVSADVGGQYGRLRRGPGAMLLAPGAHGDLAISQNGGQSWQVIATQTSQELVDVAFGTPSIGYALDASGGLQRTNNGGASWQTLSPGTSGHASSVAAVGEHAVLLIGPVGISRAVNGGAFEPSSAAVVRKADVSDYESLGPTVFAWGPGTHSLIRSTDEGAHWSAINLPLQRRANKPKKLRARPGVFIRSVSFTSATSGMLLDTEGRIFSTRNGGRSWSEIVSAATRNGVQLAFATPSEGFMSVRIFAGDGNDAYVMRTSNGGASWHPQEITTGTIPGGGLVASTGLEAAALVDGTSGKGEPLHRLLFTTQSGGEVSGSAGPLTLTTATPAFTKHKLKAVRGAIRVSGALRGAIGGETIVVARRDLSGGFWQEQRVVAGANGGSFSTTWHITRSSVFVAQWAGDSGRPGQGSAVLKVVVK
jgi:photosystem II stability/assembly factor-like uncharacterized protein